MLLEQKSYTEQILKTPNDRKKFYFSLLIYLPQHLLYFAPYIMMDEQKARLNRYLKTPNDRKHFYFFLLVYLSRH